MRRITEEGYEKERKRIILKYLKSGLPEEEARRQAREDLERLKKSTYIVRGR